MAVQITTTTDSREEAVRIAKNLLNKKLAACVQIVGPITSFYSWEGELKEEEEYMCLIKTREELMDAVGTAITVIHSYERPEIIGTSIVGGSQDYLDWIAEETEK